MWQQAKDGESKAAKAHLGQKNAFYYDEKVGRPLPGVYCELAQLATEAHLLSSHQCQQQGFSSLLPTALAAEVLAGTWQRSHCCRLTSCTSPLLSSIVGHGRRST